MFSRAPAGRMLAIAAALLMLTGGVVAKDDGEITLRLEQVQPDEQFQQQIPQTTGIPQTLPKAAPPPKIEAASAILVDAQTGQVLYSKNEHVKRPNASTTKIMTAILIIENCKMTDIITASKNAAQTPYTSLHLQVGEKISAKDLLFGLMIRSANDAAVAAAEHIAGSVPKFAKMMNQKAAEIGCKNTRFVTPNGLHDPNHYSTAYDLALMARYALRYPIFNEAVSTSKYTLSSRTKNKQDTVVFSRHQFMRKYPYADGIKSGYVKQARYCYVGSATRDGWRLVSAVLRSEHSADDSIALMNYGFTNFQPVTVAKAGQPCGQVEVIGGATMASAAPVKDLRVVVPRTGATVNTKMELKTVTAPLAKNTPLGTVAALVDGAEVARVELRAMEPVGLSVTSRLWNWMKSWGIVIACLAVCGRYGTTFTKDSRRRRRRISAALRDFNRYR